MKKIIIGNLKMNLLSAQDCERYLQWLEKELAGKKLKNSEIVLCPPFVHLAAFKQWNKKGKVSLGAQNMFPETKGSYTGEISPLMLKNFDCEYVILGHSERRRYFAENNHEINLKVMAVLKNGLQPILCVGETKAEKEDQLMLKIITKQIKEALANVNRTRLAQIVIAYEPVWAVGSDSVPSTNEIMGARVLIRKVLVEMFGKKYAQAARILYGGSVNVKTAKQVCLDAEMDGVLVGRESLVPREFLKIAEIINNY